MPLHLSNRLVYHRKYLLDSVSLHIVWEVASKVVIFAWVEVLHCPMVTVTSAIESVAGSMVEVFAGKPLQGLVQPLQKAVKLGTSSSMELGCCDWSRKN